MRFHVGQRVRVNHPGSINGYHRCETVVVALDVLVTGCDGPDYFGIEVDLPNKTNSFDLYPRCVYRPHELEPILDSDQSAEDARALGRELLGRWKIGAGVEVAA